MTWKTYATVSGATALATWVASWSPSGGPTPVASVEPESRAAISAAALDMLEEGARLRARLRAQVEFEAPERNPFEFGGTEGASRARQATAAAVAPAQPVPTAPAVSLAGIAADRTEAGVERTAVLSMAGGILLVREGDDVVGRYRVGRIEPEAVELVGLTDGATLRLTLK